MHYHGTPITPRSALLELAGRCFCVSFARADDLKVCHEIGQSVMLDNGAFSNWKGTTRRVRNDWPRWWAWAEPWLDFHSTWAVCPDAVDGDEAENDLLVSLWARPKVVPVWHLHETLVRLADLVYQHGRVCFGSSREFAVIGSEAWRRRVSEAFDVLADEFGRVPWIHMLRGMALAGSEFPFASVDSTDVGRNHNRNGNPGAMARRWDSRQCPPRWTTHRQLAIEGVRHE